MTTTTIYTDKLVPLKRSIPRYRRMWILRRLAKLRKTLSAAVFALEYALIYILVTGMWGGVGA